MFPGKTYKPADFIAIGLRYKRWIIVPTIVFAVGTGVASRFLPDKYRSETVVLVVPQRIPETYVRATVTARIEERVRTIREQILSRSRLERIINELHLYAEDRAIHPMEVVVDEMRDNVSTRVVRENAFSVSFVANDPVMAQRVTERLASMFSEENSKDREYLAESTNQFLETQLADARERLTEQEKKVEAYRRQFSGELPEQVGSNLQAIQNTEVQIQNLLQSINSDRDRRLILQRQLADVTTGDALPTQGQATGASGGPTTAQQLDTAEDTLRALEMKFTPEHPAVGEARRNVQALERKLLEEQSTVSQVVNTAESRRASTAAALRDARMRDLSQQLEAIDKQIGDKQAEEKRLRGIAATYRAKVETAPTRETDLLSLTRDYQTLQQQYQNLLKNFEESKIAANLERKQIGEQLQVLDPARIPERPFTPNRPLIAAAGTVAGFGLGLALVFLLEFRDRTLRSPADVLACCGVPVIATLTSIRPQSSRRRLRVRRLAAYGVGALLVLGGALAVVGWRTSLLAWAWR